METNEIKKKVSKRSILFWIGSVFCFIVFPIFLLDIGLDSYVNTINEIEEREAYRKLEINLEKVLKYGDGRHYYHSLLKKIFDIAELQNNPVEYLEKAIPYLKKRNPNVFNFIIWNSKGEKIIESLTDEKEHKYILKVLIEIFKEVTIENNKKYPVDPKNVAVVEKKFNIIKSYIGNFIVEEGLLFPLLRGNLGKIVPASSNRNKSYFWYQYGEKIIMMATINKAALESMSYIEKLINGMNKLSSDGIKFGLLDLLHEREFIQEENEIKKSELKVALAKYENYSNNKLSSDDYIILIKILNPFTRIFCYTPKKLVFKNSNLKEYTLITAILIIITFFLGIWILYRFTNYNFSVNWKLTLFFMYANGLPLIVLSFIGYDYIQQNRNIHLSNAYDNISQILNDFDSKFDIIKNNYSSKFNEIINLINSNLLNKDLRNKNYQKLKEEVEKINCDDFSIVDVNKNVIVGTNKKLSNTFVKNSGGDILAYINRSVYTPKNSFASENSGSANSLNPLDERGIFFDTVISKKGRIVSEHALDDVKYYYFNFIGDTEKRKFEAIMIASWLPFQLQENYVKANINDLNNNSKGIKYLVFSEKYGKIFPEEKNFDEKILGHFSQIINLTSLSFDKIVYNGKSYAAFGSMGKKLDQIALLGLFPLDIINEEINKNYWRLFIFIAISFVLTLGVSWLLSAYFIEPIKELNGGIEAMRRQEFTYRLPIHSADEFGELTQVFNSALESLEDLSVATTVQENLFPLEPLKQNRLLVWGKSVTMTRLGGDYFDFFSLNDKEVGVLMGDVAGHGVPAGFLMAMAKAAVLLSEENKNSPSKLLSAIHKVFYHVKSKKIKRMMTCLYFCINTETGSFVMANAGHCYPVFIDSNRNVSFLEKDGTPLGVTKRTRYSDIEGQLEENSYMLLYTDGMLEAHNLEGESIGIDRFKELVSSSYSEDPEIYYKNIFAGYKKWSPLADDDITMVLVKYGFDGLQQIVADNKIIEGITS